MLKYLENIENFDENGQLSVFQGKIGQFSKLFAKIMRNLEEKKKKLTSNLPRFTRGQKSEEKVTKIIVRLTRGRKKGRKKGLDTNKENLKKVIFFKEKF